MPGLQSGENEIKDQSTELLPIEPNRVSIGLTARPATRRQEALAEFDRDQEGKHSLHPRRPEFLSSACLLMENHEPELAKNLLRELLQSDPSDGPAIRAMALCCSSMGNAVEAEQLLRILLTIDNRAEHLIDLADCLYVQCNDHEALKYYLMALRTLASGESAALFAVYKNVGNIFVRSHDFDSAEENYNKAYTIDPKSDLLMVNFGTLEIQKGNLGRAVEHFRQAVEINPNNDRAWVGLAIVHREFGDIELSWANLDKSMDLNPYNETAMQLGLSWTVKDQRWHSMIERLQKYLTKNSQDAVMSLALTQLYYLAGRYTEARLEIERTLNIDPEIHGGGEMLALIKNEESGRFESRIND